MKIISASTIGNLISAHYEGDNEKFDAFVKFIIEAYEEQGEQRKADIIRKRADGSYKNSSKAVLDNNTIDEILEWIEDDIDSHTEKIGERILKSYPSCETIVAHLKEMKNK